jgi:hypothetical protein
LAAIEYSQNLNVALLAAIRQLKVIKDRRPGTSWNEWISFTPEMHFLNRFYLSALALVAGFSNPCTIIKLPSNQVYSDPFLLTIRGLSHFAILRHDLHHACSSAKKLGYYTDKKASGQSVDGLPSSLCCELSAMGSQTAELKCQVPCAVIQAPDALQASS